MSNKNNSMITGANVPGKNKSRKIKRKDPQVNWSALPDDVLRRIFEGLNWVDRLRMRAVSKKFPSLLRGIPWRPIHKFPWLMSFSCREIRNESGILCKIELSDPSSEKTYSFKAVEQEDKKKHLLGARICCSSHGWVLLSREKLRHSVIYSYLCLYTPFGHKFIELPGFACLLTGNEHSKMAFSMDPNSLECVFHVTFDERWLTVNMKTWHIGDQSWKNLKSNLPANVSEIEVLEDVAYADGLVYCIFNSGRGLGIFDVQLEHWKFFSDAIPGRHVDHHHLVAFNGDMFLFGIWFSHLGFWKLDKSLNQWVRQQSLGDLVLFTQSPSIMLAEAVGESSSYANTIHFLIGPHIMYVLFGDDLWGMHERRKSFLYKGLNIYARSTVYCWIQPPLSIQH